MTELDIEIGNIMPNEWNPNELDDVTYKVLKDSISGNGFLQRILVRPKGDKYEIIDGYHRFKCLQELGVDTVKCMVEEHTDAEAMVLTLSMNRFRGNLNAMKVANIFSKLKDQYSVDELSAKLGYDENYIENLLAISAEESSALEELTLEEDSPDTIYTTTFFLSQEEYSIVQQALTKAGGIILPHF